MLAAGFGVRDLQGVLGEMKLEQSEQEREFCSKRGRSRKNEIGAKQAGLGELLQAGKIQMKWSRSKVSRKGRLAPSRKVVGEMELEQSEQD